MRKALMALAIAVSSVALAGSAEGTTYAQYELTFSGFFPSFDRSTGVTTPMAFSANYVVVLSSDQMSVSYAPCAGSVYCFASLNSTGLSVSSQTSYRTSAASVTASNVGTGPLPDLETANVTASSFTLSDTSPDGFQWNGPLQSIKTTFSSTPFAAPLGVAFTTSTSPLPESASWAMMLAGFALVGNAVRRKRQWASSAA